MTMTAWRLWPIPILVAAAACEWKDTSRVGVQVMAPLVRALDDGTRYVPVLGAVIRIECPNGVVEELGPTDANGWVLVTTRAPVSLGCDVAVDDRGRRVALVRVHETCSRKEAGECRDLDLRLKLDPRGAPSTAGS